MFQSLIIPSFSEQEQKPKGWKVRQQWVTPPRTGMSEITCSKHSNPKWAHAAPAPAGPGHPCSVLPRVSSGTAEAEAHDPSVAPAARAAL